MTWYAASLVGADHTNDTPYICDLGSQLGVGTDAQDTDLKKAYRKQAMKVGCSKQML
jgi:preprotein translocase subunit Sec63